MKTARKLWHCLEKCVRWDTGGSFVRKQFWTRARGSKNWKASECNNAVCHAYKQLKWFYWAVMYPDFWGADQNIHSWCWVGIFSKFVPPNALKMVLSVLKFLCKLFSKLLKFTLRNTCPRGWYLKNSWIHKQNLYGYKLVRAVKQSELRRCSM